MKLSILPKYRSGAFYILVTLLVFVALYAGLGTLLAESDPSLSNTLLGTLILCGPFAALSTPILLIASHFDQAFAEKYNL